MVRPMIMSSFERHTRQKRVRFFDECYESASTPRQDEEAERTNDVTLSNPAPIEGEYSEWQDDDEDWEADDDLGIDWEEEDDSVWGAVGKFKMTEDADENGSESGDTDITYVVSEASFVEIEDDSGTAEGEITPVVGNDTSDALDAASVRTISNADETSTSEDFWLHTHEFRTRSDRVLGMVWTAVREARLSEEKRRTEMVTAHQAQLKVAKSRELRQYHSLLAVQQENESLKNDVEILALELDKLRSRIRDEEMERVAGRIDPWGRRLWAFHGRQFDFRSS